MTINTHAIIANRMTNSDKGVKWFIIPFVTILISSDRSQYPSGLKKLKKIRRLLSLGRGRVVTITICVKEIDNGFPGCDSYYSCPEQR